MAATAGQLVYSCLMERKFRIEKTTKYGLHLIRERSSQNESVGPIMSGDLPSAQRLKLRNVLAAIGVALVPTDIAEEESVPFAPPSPERAEPSPELIQPAVEFMAEPERRLAGYQATWTQQYDEVVFVDDTNFPVGAVSLDQEYLEERTNAQGEQFTYAIKSGYGGGLDLPERGIPREWLEASRSALQAQYEDVVVGDQYNVIASFRAALEEADEPVLVQQIESGQITTLEGIVRYFAEKPVVGAPEYTRLEYVYEKIEFPDVIPHITQAELRRLIPGLCAQESKFNNGLTSRTGAKGIFQFIPGTWSGTETSLGLGMQPEEINSLAKQVEAAGQHFGNIYNELQHHVSNESWGRLRSWFDTEAAFEEMMLAPLMVNAYNAGAKRVADAVEAFMRAYPDVTDAPDTHATFFAITDFARDDDTGTLKEYGQHANEYYPRVAAAAAVFSPQR